MADFSQLFQSASLLLALLNPFLLVVYLSDLIRKLDVRSFQRVLVRAGWIAAVVFACFAILGDAIFSRVMKVQLASFQIFGGIIFVIIGLQFVFRGPSAITSLRGPSVPLAGAVAMPVMIGPGTISASILIGKRHSPPAAVLAVLAGVAIALLLVLLLKRLHDRFHAGHEELVDRSIEVAGRITSLYIGTVAVEMIMRGVGQWLLQLGEL